MSKIPNINTTTRQSSLSGGVDNNILVRSQEVDPLIDRVNSLSTSDGIISVDNIVERTTDSGVTIDGVLIKDGTITTSSPIINSVDPAITATGVDDTDGYALTKEINIITGGAADTGVELPSAVVGLKVVIANLTTSDKKVYANSLDAIDDKTATTGSIIIKAEQVVTLFCYTTALWQSDAESSAQYQELYVDTIKEFTAANGVSIDGVVVKDSAITTLAPNTYSFQTGITAFATGGQTNATALTEEINNITVCATAGDSVKLPLAVAGQKIFVKNSGAASLDVFPNTANSIDALAVNLAIRIEPSSSVMFFAINSTVWESSVDGTMTLVSPTTNTGQLVFKATASSGNTSTTITNASQAGARIYTIPDASNDANFLMSEGINAYSVSTGITAFATGGQASATLLSSEFNDVNTVATTGDSVKLPPASAGLKVTVKNNAINALDCFPSTSDSINDLAVDTAIRIPGKSEKTFVATDATIWEEDTQIISTTSGTAAIPSYTFNDQVDLGLYKVSATQLGFTSGGSLTSLVDDLGLMSDSLRIRVEPATLGTGVTAVSYGDGKNFTTDLTLTGVSYSIAGAAAEAVNNLIFTFPAGAHVHSVTYGNLTLTGGGTVDADTPDVGIGSTAATGAFATLDLVAATAEDYVTGQTWSATCNGTNQEVGPIAATSGVMTGISLNASGDVKTMYLNIADTWAGADTLTVAGTISLKWTILS